MADLHDCVMALAHEFIVLTCTYIIIYTVYKVLMSMSHYMVCLLYTSDAADE